MVPKDNLPSSTLAPLSKKLYEEVLTAHNISVLLLIRAYISDKDNEISAYSIKRRRGFCKLVQYLLQSPDFSFSEFLSVILKEKYCLEQSILKKFQSNVLEVVNSDVDLLLNFITDTGRFLIEPINGVVYNSISIHRSCPVGIFFRKMIVFLDKLTFPQTVKVYRLYQQYYLMGKDSVQNESRISHEQRSTSAMSEDMISQFMSIEKSCIPPMANTDKTELGGNMEISVMTQNPFTNPIVALFGVTPSSNADEKYVECLSWSHRQTELFLAEQATFLQFDESSALAPPELHRILNRIIAINPDYSETYFVSYLNCLRIHEFNGALENLFQFFDSVNFTDKTKSYRYAALNLAIFNVKFGNRASAVTSLRECIILSHESNDNICLHIAQAWLRCLNEDKKLDLIESTVLKCDELELFQIASLSLQMCAQKLLNLGLNGSLVFNLLDKSDAINAQRMLPDLTLTSVAYRSSVWCSYGQLNIAFLISQILLNIDTSYAVYGLTTYNTEEVCTSICNIANFLSNVGKYQIAKVVLHHATTRFPHEFSKWWKMCEQILIFECALHTCLWNDAYEAAHRIANVDKKESMLRLAELSLERGDKLETASQIDDLIQLIDENEQEIQNRPYYLLRAYLIGARAKSGGARFYMLRKALAYSIRYGYPRFRALIQLELAKLQLELGFIKQATQLVEKSSVLIFSENKFCEQAAALILLAKCNVASIRHLEGSSPQRVTMVKSAILKLDNAKLLYQKLECLSKVKDIVYFQISSGSAVGGFWCFGKDTENRIKVVSEVCIILRQDSTHTNKNYFRLLWPAETLKKAILANDIELNDARNAYALEFRKIDMEYNQSYSCTSEFCSSL